MSVALLAGAPISLMHGWIPVGAQLVAGLAVAVAVARRSRRWLLRQLPIALAVGALAAVGAHWYIADAGLADDSAPAGLWGWIAATGLVGTVVVLGRHGTGRWRRSMALLAVPLCLANAALALNQWVGYFPTVQLAWSQFTAGPLPDQADPAAIDALAATGSLPRQGRVVAVTIPADASHFKHRGELVYLPPAWFGSTPPPALPTVMMIGGEFNTPADWLRAGAAVQAADDFAAGHGGNAPVLVFVDSGGSFNNDTECVNGPRGNAADHLTEDVVPYLIQRFGVSADPARWGVTGWSMGGTCAVDLVARHPDEFRAFVDIAGDLSPNTGNRAQTISRLFGGDAEAWAAFDPSTVITRHGHYERVAGWFVVDATTAATLPQHQLAAAQQLCLLGRTHGIDCTVRIEPGRHDWPFAGRAFASALPWLAGRLRTPGVPEQALPDWSPAPAHTPNRGSTGR